MPLKEFKEFLGDGRQFYLGTAYSHEFSFSCRSRNLGIYENLQSKHNPHNITIVL